MQLHFKKFGQGRPIIILHGLLGMLDNWQTIGKMLSNLTPTPSHAKSGIFNKREGAFEIFLVDARNHGHSPHSDIFNYDVMADDVRELIEEQKVLSFGEDLGGVILIGHSMGGKTAMKFAQKFPEKIEKLIVVDIAPKYYPVHNDNIFEALLAVDFSIIKSRKEVEEILAKYIPENYVRQFLLKNLYWKESGKLDWRFNLNAIYKNLENVGEATAEKKVETPTLFLRSEKSNYILESDFELITKKFPNYEIKTIPNSGHWIHAEQPDLFVNAVVKFITLNSQL